MAYECTKKTQQLFESEFKKWAITELKAYQNEENLWKINGEISILQETFCFTFVESKAFYSSTLGNSGYIRRRDDEFNLKNVKRTDLIAELKNNKKGSKSEVLEELSDEQLKETYPINVLVKK